MTNDSNVKWSGRLQSAYRYLGITLISTFLILSIFTGVSYAIYYFHDPKPRPYSSFLHSQAIHTMPSAEARAFFQEFDRMGERETYLYQPWLGFSERVYHGKRLNVDEGFFLPTRRTINVPAASGKRDLVIWMFGGSTMFGWGVPDDQTVASHLASVLSKSLPARNVIVVNHGHSYFFSSQEVLLFQILLRRGQRCDAAVFFHGTNDVLHGGEEDRPAFTDQVAEVFAREQGAVRFKSVSLRVSPLFPPVRLVRNLVERFVQPPAMPQAPTFDVLQRYRFNEDLASAAGALNHIPAFFFFQPMPPPEHQSLRPQHEARIRNSIRGPNSYFIGDIFAGDELKNIYVDHFHYGDTACRRLAESIAAKLLPSLIGDGEQAPGESAAAAGTNGAG